LHDQVKSSLNEPEDLLDHLIDGRFGFSLRGWKAPADQFFTPSPDKTGILVERRRWLAEVPEKHLFYLPSGSGLVEETVKLARAWNPAAEPEGVFPRERLRWLGETWEADFLLLKLGRDGQFRFEAGVVCFPSSWAPEEKLGKPISLIHSPVPGLNETIGDKIDRLLERLPPGQAWQRVNWGLSLSGEGNQHPYRKLPHLEAHTRPEDIFLRLEFQALVRLPQTGGILFGIQLYSFPAESIRNRRKTARTIAPHIRSMPDDMRYYKNIHLIADQFASWLLVPDLISRP